MDVGTGTAGVTERVLASLDLDRAVTLVQEVCRIPSILGEEGALAEYLAGVMRGSAFEGVRLQPVLPDRPNAIGEVSFGPGPARGDDGPHGHEARLPRVERHGALLRRPDRRFRLRPRRDGHEGRARLSDRGDRGGPRERAAGVGHPGDGGRLRPHGRPARLDRLLRRVLGRPLRAGGAHRQRGVPGSPGSLLLRRHHAWALGPHVPQARGDQRERAGGPGGARARRLEARARAGAVDRRSLRPRDLRRARADLRRPATGRSLDDPGRVRDPRRLPSTARASRSSRCAPRSTAAWSGPPRPIRASAPRSCSPT